MRTQLIHRLDTSAGSDRSRLRFRRAGGGQWTEWDRFLTLDNQDAFWLGNICDTCSFFFERKPGANSAVSLTHIVPQLREGLTILSADVVDALASALPGGTYTASLLRLQPELVTPASQFDYFSHEQIQLWGVDAFWGLPHHPRTEYYRTEAQRLQPQAAFYEFLVPFHPRGWLKNDTLATYTTRMGEGHQPTAVSLSILDVKQPANWDHGSAISKHYCLAHYLLDGHHKIFSAASTGRPVTLLAFLAHAEGVSTPEDREAVLAQLRSVAV